MVMRRAAFAARQNRHSRCLCVAETLLDVVFQYGLKVLCDRVAAQSLGLLAIDENGSGGALAGARQGNAYVGVLRFARSVNDAAHYRKIEFLDAGIALAPFRYPITDHVLYIAGKLLEHG